MAEGKADLGGELIKGATIEGNDDGKNMMGFVDEFKDQVVSENNIPLSPQWLYAKPTESKDTRQMNSLPHGASSDAIHKDSWRLDGSQDKKEWRRNVPDIESSRRWREEERETGLLGRRERRKEGDRETEYRKNDRRSEGSSIRESAESRPLPAADRWHEVTGRNSAHEGRRDSKWSSRWGPEDKEKESRTERKTDVDKEDQNAEKQSFTGNNRSLAESDSRDKWRPRHRQETQSGGSSVYRAAPGFGLEKGRGEGSTVGFAPGRGRANFIAGVPFSRPPSSGPIGAAPVNMSALLHGNSRFTFRYPRGRLLDIYRKQGALPVFSEAPEGLENVPQITKSSPVAPLAFVTPDEEEGAILEDISKGKITSSEVSYNTSRERNGRAGDNEVDVGDVTLVDKKDSSLTNPSGYNTALFEKNIDLSEDLNCSSGESIKTIPIVNGLGAAKNKVVSQDDVDNQNINSFDQKVVGKNKVNEDERSGFHDSLAKLEESRSVSSSGIRNMFPDNTTSDAPFNTEIASNWGKHLNNNVGRISDSIVPPEEMSLFYRDPQGEIQGPFLGVDIISWFEQGFFGTDLPVCLSDAPEGTPFQPLGELMPQLKSDFTPSALQVQGEQSEPVDIVRGNLQVDTHAADFTGSFASSEKRWASSSSEGILDAHVQPRTEHKDYVDPLYGRLPVSNSENLTGIPGTELHHFAGQDAEEVIYTGRPPSSMENPLGKLANDLHELSRNSTGHPFLTKDTVHPMSSTHNIPADNDLNPLGLRWSELEGTHPKHPLSSNLAKIGDPNNIMNVVGGSESSFNSIGDPSGVRDTWPSNYRRSSSSNVLVHDAVDANRLALFEQEANHINLEEHLLSQHLQKQQQQIQQQHLSRQNMHSSIPFLEQVQGSLQRQQSMNRSMPELDQFMKLHLQEQHHLQQLQQQQQLHQRQQLHQQQLEHQMQLIQQQQQQQQEQLLFEHLLQQQLHDPGFRASHVDQVLYKQRLLHELQQQSHHAPRHHEPSIEDLIQAKFGRNLHPEHHRELLEQRLRLGLQQEHLSHRRHMNMLPVEQQLLLDLQQEQLQAQQFPLALRQQLGIEKERNAGGVWSVDESGQFIRTSTGLHKSHSGRLGQLDVVQSLQRPPSYEQRPPSYEQRPPSYEQPSQLDRNMMLLEQSQRGNFEANLQPFERTGSITGGTPGPNADILNALARLQGLDVQELHSQVHPSVQRGQIPSGSAHQHLVPNQYAPSHLDALDSHWSEHNGQLSNSLIESHFNQLHLEAEKHKRDLRANLTTRNPSSWASLVGNDENPDQGWASLVGNDESPNQGLAELLHRNMVLQSSQPLDLGNASSAPYENRDSSWPFSDPALDHSFNFNADNVGLADPFRDASLYNSAEPVQQDHLITNLDRYEKSDRLASRSNSGAFFDNQIFPDIDEIEKEHHADSARGDAYTDRVDPSDLKDGKRVKKRGSKGKLSKSVLDNSEGGIEKPGASLIAQGDMQVNTSIKHGSFGSSGGVANFYDYDMGVENSYSGDLVNHRVSGILSRGSESLLKLSSQGTGTEQLVSAPSNYKGKTSSSIPSSSEEGRRDTGGNPSEATAAAITIRKETRFRQTSSSSDAPEASFIDMLKSTKKMVPMEFDASSDSADAGGKGGNNNNNKKKGKKGRQIDPSLLGFKVHSNRIMMGEIQRLDD